MKVLAHKYKTPNIHVQIAHVEHDTMMWSMLKDGIAVHDLLEAGGPNEPRWI
jgi:hypothetical protein